MNDTIAAVLLLSGALFLAIAGLGLVRMPDLFMRCQAAAKAATLGVGLCVAAVAFHFADVAVTARALVVSVFFILTAPVAASVIVRAAYLSGEELWENTIVDELKEHGHLQPPDEPVDLD